jgi:phage tail-like protein
MSRSTLQDPLKKFRYRIVVPGISGVVAFTEMSGLEVSWAVDEIRGGGQNDAPQLSLGLPTYPEVTLKRGVIIDDQNQLETDGLYNWALQAHHFQANGYNDREYRRELRIQHMYRHGLVARTWICVECLPTYFKPVDDWQGGENGNSIEELRFRHEGFGHEAGLPPPPVGGTLNTTLGIGS